MSKHSVMNISKTTIFAAVIMFFSFATANASAMNCPASFLVTYNAASQTYTAPGGWSSLSKVNNYGKTYGFVSATLLIKDGIPGFSAVNCMYSVQNGLIGIGNSSINNAVPSKPSVWKKEGSNHMNCKASRAVCGFVTVSGSVKTHPH